MATPRAGRLFLLYWALLLAASLALLLYPLYVIRPFRAQGARELMAALTVIRFRPTGMALCIAAATALAVWYWRHEHGKVRRVFSALGVAIIAACALLSRVNVYELMFHPDERPSFSPVASAKLDGREMVIAVKLANGARAYPIRSMSYHHIVNDTLDGVPIVATY